MFGDRYELLQRLGAGGMARVYLARDTVLGRTVAIKVLHNELDENEEVRARFLREARIFARLKHHHIVDIYDVVTTPEGAAAMVMEYVEGTDLHRVLSSKPRLVPELAALVIRPLADALHYAHREGVVHRDVKPANVLLGRDGSVKLSDFGIAKASEEDLLTRTGDFLGTPAYIAPEQARGDAIGPAADQYALGVVLFEMVTGKRPFEGPNTLAVLTKIMAGEYPDPRELNAAVDDDLATIIARALSLEAGDRFPDLGAMVTALERYHITVNADRQRGLIAGLVDDPNGTADVVAGEVANELITTARRAAEKGDKRNARKSVQAALARKPDLEAAHQLLRTLDQPTVDLMPPAQGGTTTTSTRTVGAGRRGPVVVAAALALTALIGVGIMFLLRTHPPGSAGVPAVAQPAVAQPPPAADQGTTALATVADAAPPPVADAAPLDAAPPDAAPDAAPARVAARPKPARPAPDEDAPARRAPKPTPKPEPKPAPKAEPPPPAAASTAPGTLAIAAAPWADVYVDGKHRGRTPYLKQLDLPPGAHALELRNPGFPPHKETVTVKSGETVTRRVRLGSRPR